MSSLMLHSCFSSSLDVFYICHHSPFLGLVLISTQEWLLLGLEWLTVNNNKCTDCTQQYLYMIYKSCYELSGLVKGWFSLWSLNVLTNLPVTSFRCSTCMMLINPIHWARNRRTGCLTFAKVSRSSLCSHSDVHDGYSFALYLSVFS